MSVIQQVALAPRLSYSRHLLHNVVDTLQECGVTDIKYADTEHAAIKRQYTIIFCMEALAKVGQVLESICGMDQIHDSVPPTISVLRAVGVKLSFEFPQCNNVLCELAVHLGSVSVDSALLQRIGIRYSGDISEDMLRESCVLAERKMRRLYPDYTIILS
ncbi:MAG: hypothetical protein F4Y82_01225 [Cenarchaeum sp. SB0665_bin_23]|nr:hypothetical protein [Cenarchaeum sp. SB0667_bin_13]MXY38031.1 hypothetical protein [Cenarchaeum sp. SB0664_bin_35]MXY60725.1 hypothetical protein [Cenarchaeum sp. SB0665_bin_23]MXZ93985.1 hypothetical protein [Cenarchaeum sp. SB0666_bin_15]MYB46224.1 hypothetical protein [Cenarchaeum sp. SB0662_bin_33]MYC79572.1 hypothetical protein [Cenarchaeum sp. SB0661_bin_35]MYD58231.1 hypothetical protein [Cenarchaeum sp. SB0678_bin_8]MYG32737.1 hypothetical protein [Cenarchaeum sp. SB0677_bin_16]